MSQVPEGEGPSAGRLGATQRVKTSGRISLEAMRVWIELRRKVPLPELAGQLAAVRVTSRPSLEPSRLGRIVYRVMNVGPFRPRCITMALVLLRMLHRQGTHAELVVGLPEAPEDHLAHAWVEVEGRDVGPPPGKGGHKELVRYGGRG